MDSALRTGFLTLLGSQLEGNFDVFDPLGGWRAWMVMRYSWRNG